MKAICRYNSAALAPGDEQDKASHPQYVHEELIVGQEYEVFAMMIYDDRLAYLVDVGWPTWKSHVFFATVDDRVSPDWRFMSNPEPPAYSHWQRRWPQAVWGYGYLIDNLIDHNDGLLEGLPTDVEIFRREVEARRLWRAGQRR